MKQMSLKEIAAACGGTYFGKDEFAAREVTGVAIDSRKIETGFLFVPIKGARVDGHDFIPQVIEKGALATLSEKPLGNVSFPYILVESAPQALKDIARHYRQALGIKVVGISGSVGKTSTKEMIASVLAQKYHVLKTEGNFNNEIGLPLTVFRIREEHEVAVLEMGISDFGEMDRLAAIAQPDICVITNIGYCHLEQLGDRLGVLRAKTEMFRHMHHGGDVILNGDDDMLVHAEVPEHASSFFFGRSSQSGIYASDVEDLGLRGTACTIHLPSGTLRAIIPIPGAHMVYNALAGAAVGMRLGLSLDEIRSGIEALRPVSGRNNIIETEHYMLIDDCYNANPVSMKASIDVLTCALGRKVAILGDMFELGANEKEMHYEVGVYAAQKAIDVLICIGTLAQQIAEGAKSIHHNDDFHPEIHYFATKEEFLQHREELLTDGDSILIKASHGMEFPVIVEALQ